MDKTKIHKMWIADQGDGTYSNPILYTDYSDPDAIRVGEDYFMIASSFCNTSSSTKGITCTMKPPAQRTQSQIGRASCRERV